MIAIVNYGLGNIRAFVSVYKNLNISCIIAAKADDLKGADKIILPGVGAFDYAMQLLQKSGMKEYIDRLVLKHKIPILGICVGMQMMAYSSEEGILPGLGWVRGRVKKINASKLAQKTHLPHMGWNSVKTLKLSKLFTNFEPNPIFYFLHSYCFACSNKKDVLAVTEYGETFASAVNSDNIYGVQFHPEKSHQNGIQLLKNFANL